MYRLFSLRFFNLEGHIEIDGGGHRRVVVTPTVLHIQLVCTVATMHGLHAETKADFKYVFFKYKTS